VQAALVVPSGFSASMAGNAPLSLTTLTSADNATAGNVTASIASSLVAQLNADRLSVATAVAAGAPLSASLQAAAATLSVPVQAGQQPIGARPIKAVSYYSSAMAIFFLFFLIGYTARSFFVDRSQGMIERMRAAPVRPLEILLGKALSVFVFGTVSLLTVAAITSAGFGADWGGAAGMVVCLAVVATVVCLTALVIGVARTQRQAEGMSSAIVFGLAILGGNFVFLSTAPSVMRRLALVTPNGWAMRAFTDLSTVGGGFRTAATPVLAILGWAVAVGAVAAVVGRRAVAAS
jgi:ABC-2 type transport system permease protein